MTRVATHSQATTDPSHPLSSTGTIVARFQRAGWFTDDAGSVFEDDINQMAAAGITTGCNPPANDEFRPTRKVTP